MSTIWTGQHYLLTFSEPHNLAIHDIARRAGGASFHDSKIIRSIIPIRWLSEHGETVVRLVKAIDDRHCDGWQLQQLVPHERDIYLMHNDIAYAHSSGSYMNPSRFLSDLQLFATSTTPLQLQPHPAKAVSPHDVISRLQDFGRNLSSEAPRESRLPFGR